MLGTLWWSAWAIVAAVAGIAALRILGERRVGSLGRMLRAHRIAAARIVLGSFVVLLGLALIGIGASRLPQPLQWTASALGAACAIPWLANAVAGLWLLSSLGDSAAAIAIVAGGQPSRVVSYGLTRLELETEAGWHAHLSYIAAVWKPVLLGAASRPRGTEFAFQASGWTQDKVQFLRQAAILSPYRDMSSPITVTRRADVVSVHLSLSQPGAELSMRSFLEAALARHEEDRGAR